MELNVMWQFVLKFMMVILAVPLLPFAIFGELSGDDWIGDASRTYVFCVGILLLASDTFLPIPSSLVAISMGVKLGFGFGSVAIALGLNLGTMVGYYSGWILGYPIVKRYASKTQRDYIKRFENRLGYALLVVLRSVPVLSETSVLAAGAARWTPKKTLVILFITNICLSCVYAWFGSFAFLYDSPEYLIAGGIGVPAVGVLVVVLLYRLIKVLDWPS